MKLKRIKLMSVLICVFMASIWSVGYAEFKTDIGDYKQVDYRKTQIVESLDKYICVEKSAEWINEEKTKVQTGEDGQPVEESETGIKEFENRPVITTATVDTFGKDYGVPEIKDYFDYQSFLNNYLSQYYSAQ